MYEFVSEHSFALFSSCKSSFSHLKVLFPPFCVGNLPKILDFGYFVLIWYKVVKNKKS